MIEALPSGPSSTQHVHVLTPGDHFSPSTGSAIPTVVHGLASGRSPGSRRDLVSVARGTYPDRYDSADVTEYFPVPPHHWHRYIDLGLAKLGGSRIATRRAYTPTVSQQLQWPSSYVFAHNAPVLIQLVDTGRHLPILYAHNELLRTYTVREAGHVLGPAAAIICVSEFLAGVTVRRLPRSLHSRVAVVRNGVDTTFFTPRGDLRRRDRLEVTFVGRMLPSKGADVILSALEVLGRSDVHVTLVGSSGFSASDPLTPFELDIRRTAARLGNRVTVSPFIPRSAVADLLGRSDVVVVPSRWAEPFALSILEGMASGAAVIASRTGGIPEAAGGAAILIPPNDPRALADALEHLATDDSALQDLRRQARAHAVDRDWVHVRAHLDRTLTDLVRR